MTCRWDNCESEYRSCSDGSGDNVFGSRSCTGIGRCFVQECAEGDYACGAECIWDGTLQVRRRRTALRSCRGQCAIDNSSPDAIRDSVYRNQCVDELRNCGKAGSTITRCGGLVSCIANCSRNDEICRKECGWKAKASAQGNFQNAYSCVLEAIGPQAGGPCGPTCTSGGQVTFDAECTSCIEGEGGSEWDTCDIDELF